MLEGRSTSPILSFIQGPSKPIGFAVGVAGSRKVLRKVNLSSDRGLLGFSVYPYSATTHSKLS